MPDQSTQSILIGAPAADIMAVIADFERYPEWTVSLKHARVLETGPDERARRVEFVLDAGVIQDRYELEYLWTGDERVEWTLTKGQMMRAQEGSYVLEPADDGTLVTYRLSVELFVPVLGLLKSRAEKVIMDIALKELKRRVEGAAPAAEEEVAAFAELAEPVTPRPLREPREVGDVRVVLFTGKGGVGKTTTAAATAVRLADTGVRTLLLSTDSAHSVGDTLGMGLTDEPTEVLPNLWAGHVQAQQRFEAAWRSVQSYLLSVLSRSGIDPIVAEELTVMPGVEEVLALLAVRDYALTGQWDAVVVDCAATADTLRLLALPEALRWYLTKAFPAARLVSKGMRPVAGILNMSEAIAPEEVFDALVRLSQELASVRQMLADPTVTTVRLVLTPESVVVAEARRAFTAFALHGYCVDEVIANRIVPDGQDPWRKAWAATHRRQLAEIRASFGGLTVREVEYRPAEPVGSAALRDLATSIYGSLDDGDTVIGEPRPGTQFQVAKVDDGFELALFLPFTDASEIDLSRVDDDLVVTVAGRRRVLTLPSVLRRCDVAGAEVVDDHLTVRFRPNPKLWPDALSSWTHGTLSQADGDAEPGAPGDPPSRFPMEDK